MNKILLKVSWLSTMVLLLASFELPNGWLIEGSQPQSYEMGIDKGASKDGSNCATIKSIDKKIKGFGTLMQICEIDNKFRGKRVRMTGLLKTKNVSTWAGLWFRVDRECSKHHAGFDNMQNGKRDRSIHGTTDWATYEIVLDVPADASEYAFGALLVGKGQIWFDDIRFETVDLSIATTGIDYPYEEDPIYGTSTNLNFDR